MFKSFIYLLLLIFVKGFIKTLEMSVFFVNKNKLRRNLDDDENRGLLNRIIKNSSKVEVSLKFVHMIITFFLSVYFITFVYKHVLDLVFKYFTIETSNIFIVFTLALIIFIIIILVFIITEIFPKNLGSKQATFILKTFSVIVYIIYAIIKPFASISIYLSDLIADILKIPSEHLEDYSEEEIRAMVDVSRETGNIDENEMEMINNIFEFDNKSAGEIATHRTDIVALNIKASKDEIIKIITEEKYSRMPVYEDNIDNIIGILHIKDILHYLIKPEYIRDEDIDLKRIIREAKFLPESKKTDELFEEMQRNRLYMVIIIDEYGGTSGIVTIEDLIEEVMGNILDEYDDHELPDIEKINESTFFISGSANVLEVAEALDIEIEADEYDTIGGFLTGQLGHVPEDGEKYEIDYNGIIFKINNVIDKRIISLVVYKNE